MFQLSSLFPSSRAPRKTLLLVPVALAATLAGFGCGGTRPQNDPYLQKKFEGIEKQLEAVEKTSRSVSILEQEMEHVASKLDGEMGLMGGSLSPEQQDALTKLAASVQTIEALRADLDAAKAKIADLERSGGSRSSSPVSSSPSSSVRAESANVGRAVAPANTKPAASTKSSKKGGFYYRVQTGETLNGVAQRHGVSAGSLAQANRLPEGAKLGVGQRLWIP